jgi:hypothetical protein
METFISDVLVVEGALLSFLLGLFMTWLGLHGLFRLISGTANMVQPIQLVANGQIGSQQSNAA